MKPAKALIANQSVSMDRQMAIAEIVDSLPDSPINPRTQRSNNTPAVSSSQQTAVNVSASSSSVSTNLININASSSFSVDNPVQQSNISFSSSSDASRLNNENNSRSNNSKNNEFGGIGLHNDDSTINTCM